jgi:uncharacterized protein involved in copper resistance
MRRWALWVFALALLLKAAVPLLATASAHVQGKTLVEVCTVYGVATVALDGQESAPQSDHGQAHAGDHCALSGAVALATPPVSLPALEAAARLGAAPLSHPSSQAPDACATWVARLKHGPPAFS